MLSKIVLSKILEDKFQFMEEKYHLTLLWKENSDQIFYLLPLSFAFCILQNYSDLILLV